MRRGYFFRLIIILVLLYGLIRVSVFIPTAGLKPFLADKVIALQKAERYLEQTAQDFGAAFQLMALQRQKDREYELLYKKQQTSAMLSDALLRENNRLRNALKLPQVYANTAIPAEITGRSADNWFRFVTVDKGSNHGLRAGMMAMDSSGLVGYIYDLGQASAKVILISDPLVNVSCVNERTGEIYVLSGGALGRLNLQYATLHSDIAVGDRLLTSGYSHRFRKNVPIAVVTEVALPRNSLAKKVIAKPLANISGLDILFFVR